MPQSEMEEHVVTEFMSHKFICIGEIHSNQNISNILLQNNKQKLLGVGLVALGESIVRSLLITR